MTRMLKSPRRAVLQGIGVTAALTASMALSGCGFRPVYGRNSATGNADVRAALSAVRVMPLSDRSGQRLGQILREKLQTSGDGARYELEIRMTQQTQELGVRKDSTTSRANFYLGANIALYEQGTRVFTDSAQSIVSYNILDDQYATVASQGDAVDRALLQIGEEIRTRLAIYFDRRLRPQNVGR